MGETARLLCHRCGFRSTGAETVCPQDGLYLITEEEHAKNPRDAFLGSVLGGKYPILGIIGAGGMGAVYRSVQPMVERPVAIKVILPGGAFKGDEAKKRFLREARTIAHLDHPAVVTLHDFGTESDGTLYMVMELVQGRTLYKLLRQGGLTTRQVVGIGLSILEALEAAHAQGIVHRDMKPENVMLLGTLSTGRSPRVKVLDFGLAKMLGGSSSRLTRTGMVSGTPHYMSPEQATGGSVDGRSDLCSLAAMLYEALVGHPPFVADHPLRLLALRVSQDGPPLPALPWIPAGLDSVLARAMKRLPDDRWQSAGEMATALARVPLGPESDLPLPPSKDPGEEDEYEADVSTQRPAPPSGSASAVGPAPAEAPSGPHTLLDSGVHGAPAGDAPGVRAANRRGGSGPIPDLQAALETISQQTAAFIGETRRLPGTGSDNLPATVGLPALRRDELPPSSLPEATVPTLISPIVPVNPLAEPLADWTGGPAPTAPLPPLAGARRGTRHLTVVLVALLLFGAGALLAYRFQAANHAPPSLPAEPVELSNLATEPAGARPVPLPPVDPTPEAGPAETSPPPPIAATGSPVPEPPAPPEEGHAAPLDSAPPVEDEGRSRHTLLSEPPGAQVFGPGKQLLGVTPLTLEEEIAPGKVARYRVKLKGFKDQVVSLPLDGTERRKQVKLRRASVPASRGEVPLL